MKKTFIYIIAAAVLAAGCAEIQQPAPAEPQGIREFIEVSVAGTKVSLGNETAGQYGMQWEAGDQVAVIDGAAKSIYELYEGAGTQCARFRYVSGEANPAVITDVVYPATASGEVPVNQNYTPGSFDPDAPVLVYHNETGKADDPILLKNRCSYLCFQLTGHDKVNGIKVAVKGGKTYALTVPEVQLEGKAVQPFYLVVPAQENARTEVTFSSAAGSMSRILASKTFVAGKMHRFAKLPFKADKTFCLMSYNIGQCNKTSKSSPAFIANIVKELKADVVVMNEVKSLPFGRQDQQIAESLGWEKFYRPAITGMGNAIAYSPSCGQKLQESSFLLKNITSEAGKYDEDRVCLFVEFEDFVLVGSHLERNDFAAHSAIITKEVEKRYKGNGKSVFFCGDMNTRPYAPEMRAFEKDWTLLSREDQATLYNPDLPNSLICIDYIFAWKGGAPVQVLNAHVCKQVACGNICDASDHFPICVDVKVGNSSLPLMEDNSSLGEYDIVEDKW